MSEERLTDLEKEELALIESLQKCQEEQRQAYSQIDEALMAGGAKADQVSRMLEVAPRARAPLR